MSDRTEHSDDEHRMLPSLLRSRHMKGERRMVLKMLILFVVLITAIIMGILSIYWGADHSLQFNEKAATISVIDLDRGEVGPALQAFTQNFRNTNPSTTLGYISANTYTSNAETIAALKHEDFWVGIVIQANATTLMNYAYQNGNTSYDPTGAIHIIFEEGRNELAVAEYMLPQISAVMLSFVSTFAKEKQASLLAQNMGNAAALALQADLPIPISYAMFNLAPAIPSTAEAATEIGTIYLIIISFVSVLMVEKLHMTMMGLVSMRVYYIYRMLLLPCLYFFFSLLYLALSCAWKIPFDRFFGGVGYFLFWMLSYCAMLSFGLVVENFNNAIGQPFTAVFFVFWVISNVATGFYPIELLSNFYKWGLAWPLRHDLIGAKAIIYGTKNVLGLNFGVILAWVGLSLVLLPFTIMIQVRKNKGQWDEHRKQVLDRVYGKEKESSA